MSPAFGTLGAVLRPVVALVAVVVLALAACGGDDADAGQPDPEAFCRLARDARPIDEVPPEPLAELAAVAPPELAEPFRVLRDAADRLAGFAPGDPEAIGVEFEIRFDPTYVAARSSVEAYLAEGCRLDPAGGTGAVTSTPTSTTGVP